MMAFGRITVRKCGGMAVIRYIIDPAIFAACVVLFVKLHRIEVRREQQQERVEQYDRNHAGIGWGVYCDRRDDRW